TEDRVGGQGVAGRGGQPHGQPHLPAVLAGAAGGALERHGGAVRVRDRAGGRRGSADAVTGPGGDGQLHRLVALDECVVERCQDHGGRRATGRERHRAVDAGEGEAGVGTGGGVVVGQGGGAGDREVDGQGGAGVAGAREGVGELRRAALDGR